MGKLGCTVNTDARDHTGVAGAARAAAPIPPSVQTAAAPGAPVRPAGVANTSFGDFYADHYADLVRLATLLSGSADAAPDLVQDCFVRLPGHWTAVHAPLPYV